LGFQNVAVGRIKGVAAVTAFRRDKKSGCNNDVTVWWGSSVYTLILSVNQNQHSKLSLPSSNNNDNDCKIYIHDFAAYHNRYDAKYQLIAPHGLF